MATPRFDTQPLSDILVELRRRLSGSDSAELIVPHPDLALGDGAVHYPGEPFEQDGHPLRHRPLRLWIDLAERLGCRLRLPEPVPPHHVRLAFERLGPEAPWHRSDAAPDDKYGAASAFARLNKLEEPRCLIDYLEALERAALKPGARVLSLGVNDGKELDVFALLDPELADGLTFVGIDHSAGALGSARARHPAPRHRFIEADVNRLDALEVGAFESGTFELGTFELILALDLFQSPAVDDRALLRTLVQHHIAPGGALILALPNGRYRGGELVYGARMKNYREAELSLLFKDVAFYRIGLLTLGVHPNVS